MLEYLPLLILLACPLMMVWMMRGGHGAGHDGHDGQAGGGHGAGCHGGHGSEPTREERIAELEREAARLRAEGDADVPPVIAGRR